MGTFITITATVFATCLLIALLEELDVAEWADTVGSLLVISILVLVGTVCYAWGKSQGKVEKIASSVEVENIEQCLNRIDDNVGNQR